MQLTAWLKRHEGRPGVAQSSMVEQVIDVPVTSSRGAEEAAYEVREERRYRRLTPSPLGNLPSTFRG